MKHLKVGQLWVSGGAVDRGPWRITIRGIVVEGPKAVVDRKVSVTLEEKEARELAASILSMVEVGKERG